MKVDVENKIIYANGGIFIIPNRAGKLGSFLFQEDMKRFADDICRYNELTFDPEKDYFVECWLHSREDLGCDNLVDHYGHFTIGDKEKLFRIESRWFLETVLNMKEGESRIINIPIEVLDRRDIDNVDHWILCLDTKFDQGNYRYGSFGKFEDVLRYVKR